jgi:hypothetical protein
MKMITDNDLINILSEAASGLLFISELDYPFEVFIWKDTHNIEINKEEILKITKGKPEDNIEDFDFDFLFSIHTMDQDWHSAEDKRKVIRFRNLVSVLKENLEDIKVFRRGKIYIDVYIVGRAPSGNIAGVSTKQMQT